MTLNKRFAEDVQLKHSGNRNESTDSTDLLSAVICSCQEAHHLPKAFKDVKIRDKSHEIRADGPAGSFLSETQRWAELALGPHRAIYGLAAQYTGK